MAIRSQRIGVGALAEAAAAGPSRARAIEFVRPAATNDLVGDPEWEPVIDAVGRFADALVQRPASKSRFQR
ncbi:hypothetical protein [Nocardioides sp. P5_C9_2]